MKKIISLLLLLCVVLVAFAQGGDAGTDGRLKWPMRCAPTARYMWWSQCW